MCVIYLMPDPRAGTRDGIKWWANHVKDFPNLARMARQYLGVPATSATVERLFSAVDFAFADRRKSQSAETLANLAFAKLNLHSMTAEAQK